MKYNSLYQVSLSDPNVLYLATGRLDDMVCSIDVEKDVGEPNIIGLMVGDMVIHLSAGAAAEMGRHLSSAAATAMAASARRTGKR